MLRPHFALAALLAGCGSDISVIDKDQPAGDPVCDRKKQTDEEFTDAPFDKDGDGFMDGTNPDCKAAYDEEDLDCNDGDPDIHPQALEETCNGRDDDCDDGTPDSLDEEIACNGRDDDCNPNTADAPDLDYDGFDACVDCDDFEPDANPAMDEICDDGIDNDCNDEVDEDCSSDYNGRWSLDSAVRYSCATGYVAIDFSSVQVVDLSPNLTLAVSGGAQPGNMEGSLSGDGSFYVTSSIDGLCTETYTLSGQFTGSETFEATFEAAFTGGSWCYDCTNQTWTLDGTRD